MRIRVLIFLAASSLTLPSLLPAASVRYRCVTIGSGVARGINDLGEVVGYYGSTYGYTAFYWNGVPGTPRVVLPPVAEPHNTLAHAINNHGYIVGETRPYIGNTCNSAYAYDIRAQTNGAIAVPGTSLAVNELGQVVGDYCVWDYTYQTKSFRSYWVGRVGTNIVGKFLTGGSARAINEAGIVVGIYLNTSVPSHFRQAWVYNGSSTSWLPAGIANTSAEAYGLNDFFPFDDRGLVVGYAVFPRAGGGTINRACAWDRYGVLRDLGYPGTNSTYTSVAYAVNNLGQIVGTSGGYGFISQNGTMSVLNNLISGSGNIQTAYAINDHGAIAGSGTSGAVVLIPFYVADGNFPTNTLGSSWIVTGAGSVSLEPVGTNNYAARLTAGSPVTLAQTAALPGGVFEVQFKYRFETTDPPAQLAVRMDNVPLTTLAPPPMLDTNFQSATLTVNGAPLLGRSSASLAFTFDGPTGASVLLDDINLEQRADLSPLKILQMDAANPAGVRLEWSSVSNQTYRVMKAVGGAGNFLPCSGYLPATPPTNSWTDVRTNAGAVFYRVNVE